MTRSSEKSCSLAIATYTLRPTDAFNVASLPWMALVSSTDPEQSDDQLSGEQSPISTEDVRSEGATDYMGPGFIKALKQIPSKRRAYEFWYHPYTELAIFALIIISVSLLMIEVSIPTDEPVGWLGAAATGQVTGWFFWADGVITLIFLVEYLSKLWIAPKGRKWFFVRNSWIELLAVLPVLRVFRLFRIFRAVRIFRLIRVMRSVRLMRAGSTLAGIFESFGLDLQENRAGNFVIMAYFLSAMVFGTVGVMVFERGAGTGFDTVADGLWWCIVTLSTVGYGDMVPETTGGRLIASVVVMMGLGFWSLVTGVFASTLVNRTREREKIGLDILGIHGHILICGWNENGHRLVRDFRVEYPTQHMVVVTEAQTLGIPQESRIHHLRGDPTSDAVLEAAHLDRASTVVVLAEEDRDAVKADVDARTLMICLAVRRTHPGLRVVVELLDENNVVHARSTGASDVVVTHNYTGALMSQIVQSPGLNRVYQNLFDTGRGARFGEIPFPDDCIDEPFSVAVSRLFSTEGVTAVGLRRGKELQMAPDDEPVIGAGDKAIVIEAVGGG